MSNDNLNDPAIAGILRRLRALETQAPVGFSSVTRGALRIASPEGLIVEGSARVTGVLNGDGTITWTGVVNLNGPTRVRGDMSVESGGKITVAGSVPMVIGDTIFGAGVEFANGAALTSTDGGAVALFGAAGVGGNKGRVTAGAGAAFMGWGTQYLTVTGSGVTVTALQTLGAKNFITEHPTKPGWWLRHGSTESPVSGTEYTGRALIGDDGTATIELPHYFEGLNKPGGRTAQVTPVGRPFPVGAGEIEDGQLTIYGEPGREVFWLVKAERIGGDFTLEEAPSDEDYRAGIIPSLNSSLEADSPRDL